MSEPEAPLAAIQIAVQRLAKLTPIEYDRVHEEEAKKLNCRMSTLDAEVKKARTKGDTEKGQGRAVSILDPDPWSDSVDGAGILGEISTLIRRHVVFSVEEADAVALWVIHSHAFEVAQIAPRLLIKSPEKRCGKTTLLSTLSHLVRKPLPTSGITPAALFRIIEDTRPSLLIDEADTFISGNDDIRRLINSGHSRETAHVTLTVVVGDNHEPRQFSTWAPMALAGIGKLPGTIEDRGIAINLRRRRKDEPIERLRFNRVDHLKSAARKARRWVEDHLIELSSLDPDAPEALHDRAADNWHPLLAVADCAGGEWPDRARRAAVKLSNDGAEDQDSLGTLLLSDIRAAFADKGVDQFTCEGLVAHLVGLDDRPWAEVNHGKPLTKTGLGRLLGKFKIRSGTLHPSKERGYTLLALADILDRGEGLDSLEN
jgi:putative DNA primase/helicase